MEAINRLSVIEFQTHLYKLNLFAEKLRDLRKQIARQESDSAKKMVSYKPTDREIEQLDELSQEANLEIREFRSQLIDRSPGINRPETRDPKDPLCQKEYGDQFERDQRLYEEVMKNKKSYNKLLKEYEVLCKTNRKWKKLSETNSIKYAARKYAKYFGLGKIPKRSPGRRTSN